MNASSNCSVCEDQADEIEYLGCSFCTPIFIATKPSGNFHRHPHCSVTSSHASRAHHPRKVPVWQSYLEKGIFYFCLDQVIVKTRYRSGMHSIIPEWSFRISFRLILPEWEWECIPDSSFGMGMGMMKNLHSDYFFCTEQNDTFFIHFPF